MNSQFYVLLVPIAVGTLGLVPTPNSASCMPMANLFDGQRLAAATGSRAERKARVKGYLQGVEEEPMRHAGILLAVALVVGASGSSYAQQTIKGKVAAIDKAAGKISIQIAGTAGSGTANADATVAPTPFKVGNPQLLGAVAKGDWVTVTTETVNGVATIKSIKKE